MNLDGALGLNAFADLDYGDKQYHIRIGDQWQLYVRFWARVPDFHPDQMRPDGLSMIARAERGDEGVALHRRHEERDLVVFYWGKDHASLDLYLGADYPAACRVFLEALTGAKALNGALAQGRPSRERFVSSTA